MRKAVRILVVGHHGSRTSTSKELLESLTHLHAGLVSARAAKYGHPHNQVISQFAQQKTPLLTTEKWGHLIFEMD